MDNTRKREAEVQVMNAHLFQWLYGPGYAPQLFADTAQALDGWRQP